MSNPDNTLDDLILTDPVPEKGKSKSILLLLALIIVLIVVGAILAKMIFSDSDELKDKQDKPKMELSTNALETNALDTKKDMDTNISNDLAPIADDPDLAPINDNAKNIPSNVDTINIDENKNKKANNKKDDIIEDKTASNLGVAPVVDSKLDIANNNDNEADTTTIKEKPKTKHHNKPKTHHKPKPKHIYGGVGNVYIQVGSFTKGPEENFLRKIRRAGFKFRIKTLSNGIRRVYVGPFRSRKEAAKVLGIVRSKIEPNAFIK